MDKLERYRSIIERELTAIVEQTKRAISAPPGLRDKTVFDRQSDYYLILLVGWNGSRLQPRRRRAPAPTARRSRTDRPADARSRPPPRGSDSLPCRRRTRPY